MKKIILFLITFISIIILASEGINLISIIMKILSLLWIYLLSKKYNVWGWENEYTRYKIHRKKTKRNICK